MAQRETAKSPLVTVRLQRLHLYLGNWSVLPDLHWLKEIEQASVAMSCEPAHCRARNSSTLRIQRFFTVLCEAWIAAATVKPCLESGRTL